MDYTKPYSALFLDRDGVINVQIKGDYVKSIKEFQFIDGALEALSLLKSLFNPILIVSNQRGVGRGLMTTAQLDDIHAYMLDKIAEHGGRIDRIYYCTSVSDRNADRKPNIGMAIRAKIDYPHIRFNRSLMVGDSLTDVEFANRAGIPAVLVGNKYSPSIINGLHIIDQFSNLLTFARHIYES